MLQLKGRTCNRGREKIKKSKYTSKCKKTAYYKSILDKQGLKTSNRLKKLTRKSKTYKKNFLNHTICFIIEKCKEQDIGTIVLGYNKGFPVQKQYGKNKKTKYSHI